MCNQQACIPIGLGICTFACPGHYIGTLQSTTLTYGYVFTPSLQLRNQLSDPSDAGLRFDEPLAPSQQTVTNDGTMQQRARRKTTQYRCRATYTDVSRRMTWLWHDTTNYILQKECAMHKVTSCVVLLYKVMLCTCFS